MGQADELIRWFNNHTRALAMLRIEQQHCYPDRPIRALLYPTVTRWSSRYLTCERLVELRAAVECLIASRLDELVELTPKGPNRAETEKKRQKTREMLLEAKNPLFWEQLEM